jgi:hypothetical protein
LLWNLSGGRSGGHSDSSKVQQHTGHGEHQKHTSDGSGSRQPWEYANRTRARHSLLVLRGGHCLRENKIAWDRKPGQFTDHGDGAAQSLKLLLQRRITRQASFQLHLLLTAQLAVQVRRE